MRAIRFALIWVLGFARLAKAQTDFFIQDIHVNPDSSVTITWPAVPQIPYHVMFADSPTGMWQNFPDGTVTAGSNVSSLGYTDTNSLAVTQRFYKVRKTRLPVIMTLVLDVSGSMDPRRGPPPGGDGTGSGGGLYLPGAVTAFINDFDGIIDKVAMVTFSTIQQNVFYGGAPAQPTQPFKSAIITAVNSFLYSGTTFSQGGLTNGLVLENNATIPTGQNAVKVVVFFTDGHANIVQDSLICPPATLLNFGGQDPPSSGYSLFDPVTGNTVFGCGATQFTSAIDGSMKALNGPNKSADALFRSVQVANQMRAAGITVYSIGVGTGVNLTFLQQVANDPNAPGYVPTPYDGEAVIANDPSQLAAVFQSIASKILYQ